MVSAFVVVVAALSALLVPAFAADLGAASQEFFVPLPEELAFTKTFQKITSRALAPIQTLISVTISTNGTVVYWDHWEDGYEDPLVPAMQATTEVWGDGNAANGCAPNINRTCTDEGDKLRAGQAIVVQNYVDIPRVLDGSVLYDGGDNIKATYPVAVTRGAYPDVPGSLLAGATELYDFGSSGWGLAFLSPVGTDADIPTNAFQYVAMYCQAGYDNTTIARNGEKFATLNKGETFVYEYIHVGDEVTATQPIQVHLITGDKGSMYEMRWFSLLSRNQASRSFVAPVGNTKAGVKLVMFNPTNASVDVTYQWIESGTTNSSAISIPPMSNALSDVIPSGSGAFIDSVGGQITVIALIDTVEKGDLFDWGCTVLPRENLSPQVLVGLGYGCTDNVCDSKGIRSVVWVTSLEDADLFIDYDNDGTVDETRSIKAMASNIVSDANDTDMSGAFIFATKAGSGEDGAPVDIAAAWGQNPDFSFKNDAFALDLGTVIIPFPTLKVSKHVELAVDVNGDGLFGPEDTVTFTIRVTNGSPRKLAKGAFRIIDPALNQMTYISGSTKYACSANATAFSVSDCKNGTAFPLDGTGLASKCTLQGKGEEHVITFQAKIAEASQITNDTLTNRGVMKSNLGLDLPFECSVPLVMPTEAPTSAPISVPSFAVSSMAPTVLSTNKPSELPTLMGSSVPTIATPYPPSPVPSADIATCPIAVAREVVKLAAATEAETDQGDS